MNEKLKQELRNADEVLRRGGIILYPTDTIWGIGCDATNEESVRKIFEIKKRAESKSMLVLMDDIGKIASYADMPDIAYSLLEANEGLRPMTIIYPNAKDLAPSLIAEDGSVGIRVTEEEFSKSLCFRFRRPIVSTSANVSGEPSAAIFDEISEFIKSAVDYVVDYRREDKSKHLPSSIIKLGVGGEIQIIRK